MLVLKRKPGESLTIGGNIVITIKRTSGNVVHLAIDAPKEIEITRTEIRNKTEKENDNV